MPVDAPIDPFPLDRDFTPGYLDETITITLTRRAALNIGRALRQHLIRKRHLWNGDERQNTEFREALDGRLSDAIRLFRSKVVDDG